MPPDLPPPPVLRYAAAVTATAADGDAAVTDGAPFARPWLLVDAGANRARFGLQTAPGRIEAIWEAGCAAYPTLGAAIVDYLKQPATVAAGGYQARRAGIAIANPVDGDAVRMTNHHWAFSIAAICSQFGLQSLRVENDSKALARALPYLTPEQRRQVGGGAPRAHSVIGLVSPCTGLGVAGLLPVDGRWVALDSEGGHSSFAPGSEREIDILRYARRLHGHVSAERLVSGIGLVLVYAALAERAGVSASAGPAPGVPEIVARGVGGQCALCEETLHAFCDMLGTVAGNVAITLGARGGIYVGGGIVPRLGDFFDRSGFRARFEQKGRLSGYLEQIPTYVLKAAFPELIGMSVLMTEAAA